MRVLKVRSIFRGLCTKRPISPWCCRTITWLRHVFCWALLTLWPSHPCAILLLVLGFQQRPSQRWFQHVFGTITCRVFKRSLVFKNRHILLHNSTTTQFLDVIFCILTEVSSTHVFMNFSYFFFTHEGWNKATKSLKRAKSDLGVVNVAQFLSTHEGWNNATKSRKRAKSDLGVVNVAQFLSIFLWIIN